LGHAHPGRRDRLNALQGSPVNAPYNTCTQQKYTPMLRVCAVTRTIRAGPTSAQDMCWAVAAQRCNPSVASRRAWSTQRKSAASRATLVRARTSLSCSSAPFFWVAGEWRRMSSPYGAGTPGRFQAVRWIPRTTGAAPHAHPSAFYVAEIRARGLPASSWEASGGDSHCTLAMRLPSLWRGRTPPAHNL